MLWSLRFDGRRIRSVFSILEKVIPGFRILHLPNTKFSLSAYEHSLLSNAKKEFLPPETSIFRDVNGILVGLVIPQGMIFVNVMNVITFIILIIFIIFNK